MPDCNTTVSSFATENSGNDQPETHGTLPYGVTLLRVSLGVMWIAHALLKLLVFTLPGTAQFFASVGFPGFLAYPVFAAEMLGGLALVFGVYARQVSLALAPVMAAAADSAPCQRLGVHESQGRLGVPGVPDRGLHRPLVAR